jgi:hypothetical protein
VLQRDSSITGDKTLTREQCQELTAKQGHEETNILKLTKDVDVYHQSVIDLHTCVSVSGARTSADRLLKGVARRQGNERHSLYVIA